MTADGYPVARRPFVSFVLGEGFHFKLNQRMPFFSPSWASEATSSAKFDCLLGRDVNANLDAIENETTHVFVIAGVRERKDPHQQEAPC